MLAKPLIAVSTSGILFEHMDESGPESSANGQW